ncbi:MAG: 23S rRNA (adenine(2503)-C(2))-methyltransferase RlmN [Actinomycetia bacterium]|nr:23S rRNA (adenine(2503)-C(2))-methyltransferase RlmN [Actinomycetes bacterium]
MEGQPAVGPSPGGTEQVLSPYLVHPDELTQLVGGGEPAFRGRQLREWLYRNPVLHTRDMTNLPIGLRRALAERLWPFEVEQHQVADRRATYKWLFRMPDGAAIEAVAMGYGSRTTLCVSSQAGCALACTFCATGQFGFERHLQAGEILAQLAYTNAFLRSQPLRNAPPKVTNVVFMGLGEPLANYPRLREAIRLIVEEVGMSARSLTVSTVGVVPGIRRLADDPWPVKLAVSLHASDDDLRSRLVPLNRRYPLAEVENAAAYFFRKKRRRISLEWTMIRDVNDDLSQAEGLAAIARRLRAHVNLIALNPTPLSADRPSTSEVIRRFAATLRSRGVNVTVRDTRGTQIDAACGQLRVEGSSGKGEGPARRRVLKLTR